MAEQGPSQSESSRSLPYPTAQISPLKLSHTYCANPHTKKSAIPHAPSSISSSSHFLTFSCSFGIRPRGQQLNPTIKCFKSNPTVPLKRAPRKAFDSDIDTDGEEVIQRRDFALEKPAGRKRKTPPGGSSQAPVRRIEREESWTEDSDDQRSPRSVYPSIRSFPLFPLSPFKLFSN